MAELSEDLVVTRTVTIPASELRWRFSASGGPGGQHANTANTRVELTYDAAASTALSPSQRARVLERFGPVVRVVVTDERSQTRNRQLALRRLRERLTTALTVRPSRRATKPTRAAVERRLETKRQTARRKSDRTRRHEHDD